VILILEDAAATVFDALLTGKFKVDIFKRYKLSEAKQAHQDLEARLLKGPSVIIPTQ
jgi:NADPH2:quinone reductase